MLGKKHEPSMTSACSGVKDTFAVQALVAQKQARLNIEGFMIATCTS